MRRKTLRKVGVGTEQPVVDGGRYRHMGGECVGSGFAMDQIRKAAKRCWPDDATQFRVVNWIALSDSERLTESVELDDADSLRDPIGRRGEQLEARRQNNVVLHDQPPFAIAFDELLPTGRMR